MSMYGEGEAVAAARADGDHRVMTHFSRVNEDGELVFHPSKTKQEFKKEQDIGTILRRATSVQAKDWLEDNAKWLEQVGTIDVPSMDYKETLDVIADTEARFMKLPSKVRAAYDNDPTVFADFVRSEKGDVELVELLKAAEPPKPKVNPKDPPKPKVEPPAGDAAKVE